jgi:hypothetical protein
MLVMLVPQPRPRRPLLTATHDTHVVGCFRWVESASRRISSRWSSWAHPANAQNGVLLTAVRPAAKKLIKLLGDCPLIDLRNDVGPCRVPRRTSLLI